MNREDLLKPRYKVIADYPQQYFLDPKTNSIKVGDVLEQYLPNFIIWRKSVNGVWTEDTVHYPDRFPAIFKPLQWWEEREEKDLPEYLKIQLNEGLLVLNIKPYNYLDKKFMNWKFGGRRVSDFLPATVEEYNLFNQS